MKETKLISQEIAREISNSSIVDYTQIEIVVNRVLGLFNWSEIRDVNNKQASMIISKERMKKRILNLEAKNKYLRQFIFSNGFDLNDVESEIARKMELEGFFSTEESLTR